MRNSTSGCFKPPWIISVCPARSLIIFAPIAWPSASGRTCQTTGSTHWPRTSVSELPGPGVLRRPCSERAVPLEHRDDELVVNTLPAEPENVKGGRGRRYFLVFAACFAATACCFFWFALAVLVCFCVACFWTAFGDLSPIIVCRSPASLLTCTMIRFCSGTGTVACPAPYC